MTQEAWTYHDGDLALRGELYRPARPNGCAVLVVHEADGIGGNVRRHCMRLADLGYIAAAADMHGGGQVLAGDAMMAAVGMFLSDVTLFRRRVRAGFDALLATADVAGKQTAAIGFCFGGAAVLELARSGAEVAAVASFHGLLTTPAPVAPGGIAARVLAATGARDPLVPQDDIAAFHREMDGAGADWHLLVHGRALHSFTNPDVDSLGDARMGYDASAHRLSWTMLTAFLDETFGR